MILWATLSSLKLVDVSNQNRGVIWDQELYVNFDYIQDRTFFHTFEMEECLAGLLFEDTHEAQHFYKRVTKRQKYGSKNTINNKNAIKLQKEVDVENKATVVHGPRGEELISKQRSRYDYSNRIAENVGYRGSEPDYDEETDIEHSSKSKPTNEDPYAAYSFDEPVTIKQAPPPPPAAVESYESRESSNSVSDISISQSAAPAVPSSGPVHKLPPPPSEYVHLPPPEATMKNNLPPLPSHSNAPQGMARLHPKLTKEQDMARLHHKLTKEQDMARLHHKLIKEQDMAKLHHKLIKEQDMAKLHHNLTKEQDMVNLHSNQLYLIEQDRHLPPTRKTGPPAPPRRLTGQATGGAATQPLVSQRTGGRGLPPVPPLQQQKTGGRGLPPIPPLQQQKTGGRGLPPVPPLQQQKTGGRGPPPPARRVTGQRTGHMTGAANTNSPFAISNVPVTTFGGSSLPQHQADTYQQTSHIQQTSQQAYGGYNRAQHALPQQQQSSIPAPPPMQQQQSSIPAPPPMQQQSSISAPPPMQQQSSIPAPPPMPQQSSIPAPPPMQHQSNIPAPPPMQQQTTLNENTGDGGRDALLASIRSSGIGMLKKTDKSQIRDRSGVQVASEEKPVGAQATGGPGGLADALAAALSNRNKKVSAYADEDDGDW
ncbi:unnamed protein product [Hanseniaspora opuntiae]